ncbi:MAG: PEGA domain-containing protein [Ignavibacteriaceae bacterium]|nr:PEGA domain-containing protein [Ignavibacteriaceae bacterium]
MRILIIFFLSMICLTFIQCSEDNPTNPPSQSSKGKLVIKSNPQGARIYLMGTDTGKNTPDSLLNLEPDIYDLYLYLQYYDTAYFSVKIVEDLTTTKEITLQDGLPFVNIVLDHVYAFSGDSVKFSWVLNQDVLMDSVIVQRPIDNSPLYVTDKYFYNKELFVWKDQFGNPITYYLPPPDFGPNYYTRVEGFTYEFHFYGQKAHGTMTSFHLYISQDI